VFEHFRDKRTRNSTYWVSLRIGLVPTQRRGGLSVTYRHTVRPAPPDTRTRSMWDLRGSRARRRTHVNDSSNSRTSQRNWSRCWSLKNATSGFSLPTD